MTSHHCQVRRRLGPRMGGNPEVFGREVDQ